MAEVVAIRASEAQRQLADLDASDATTPIACSLEPDAMPGRVEDWQRIVARLDAAQQLLDEGGPEAASVRAIARKLGVAPNTVSAYFRDRDAIRHALVERLLGGIDHGAWDSIGSSTASA